MRNIRVRTFAVLSRAVEEGIDHGLSRAYKYKDDPTREELREAIYRAVLNEIDEYFEIEEHESEHRPE